MLRVRDLYKSYTMGRAVVKVLCGASFEAARGEFLVVSGASGSGKSTLLHIVGALDVPDAGNVEFNGEDLFKLSAEARRVYRCRQVGLVFQFYHLLPECNVLENVLMPRLVAHSFWGWRSVGRKARFEVEEILERVGLAGRAGHRPSELSGGERQRVAIARALINQPVLLLADEPTGNLDAATGEGILGLLAELNGAGQTIIMVTHDSKVASRAHRCVQLADGAIHSVCMVGGNRMPARLVTREVVP